MDGWIPVIVTVEPPIVPQTTKYLLKANKNGYLACQLPRILEYFGSLMHDQEGPFVLAMGDTCLPWHWLTGVLYDLHKPELPWRLVLRVGSSPLAASDIHSFWLQQVKEACYIRDGNANSIMHLSKSNTEALWESVCRGDFTENSAILRTIVKPTMKNVPLKVYHAHQQVMYKLADPKKSLGTLLHEYLPNEFGSTRVALGARPYLMGAEVPLQAPISELYKYCYIDGFLHVCIY